MICSRSVTPSSSSSHSEPIINSPASKLKNLPSKRQLIALIRQRDCVLIEKEQQIERLTAALSACGEDPEVLDKLVTKAQQLSSQLMERDRMCQALKRRVVSLDAKIYSMAASGISEAYRPSKANFKSEVDHLKEQLLQATTELAAKEKQFQQLKNELEAGSQKRRVLEEIASTSSKYRMLLEERDVMARKLLRRVSELEVLNSSMVSRHDYEAARRQKRKAEEENIVLKRQIKKLKAENDEFNTYT